MELAANASMDWDQCFAFTQTVGRAFRDSYCELIRRHMFESWTEEQRHHQLVQSVTGGGHRGGNLRRIGSVGGGSPR